jgi:hypothetical protein
LLLRKLSDTTSIYYIISLPPAKLQLLLSLLHKQEYNDGRQGVCVGEQACMVEMSLRARGRRRKTR